MASDGGGKNPEIQQPVKSSESIDRRSAMKRALGAVAGFGLWLKGTKPAEAQGLFPTNPGQIPAPEAPKPASSPTPAPAKESSATLIDVTGDGLFPEVKATEKIETKTDIPLSFQTAVRKIANSASNLLSEKEDIKVQFKPGEIGLVTYKANPITEESGGKQTIKGYKNREMYVNFAAGQEESTILEAGKISGRLVNQSFDGSPSEQFAADFSKHTGIDVNKLATGEVSLKDVPDLATILTYFDLTGYAKGTKKEDIYENPKELKTMLFENAFALWMVSSDKIADRVEKASSKEKVMLANIFSSGLKRMIDCAQVGVKFDDLGLDKKNINRVLAAGNEEYKKYFEEKVTNMGNPVSSIPNLPKAA